MGGGFQSVPTNEVSDMTRLLGLELTDLGRQWFCDIESKALYS